MCYWLRKRSSEVKCHCWGHIDSKFQIQDVNSVIGPFPLLVLVPADRCVLELRLKEGMNSPLHRNWKAFWFIFSHPNTEKLYTRYFTKRSIKDVERYWKIIYAPQGIQFLRVTRTNKHSRTRGTRFLSWENCWGEAVGLGKEDWWSRPSLPLVL